MFANPTAHFVASGVLAVTGRADSLAPGASEIGHPEGGVPTLGGVLRLYISAAVAHVVFVRRCALLVFTVSLLLRSAEAGARMTSPTRAALQGHRELHNRCGLNFDAGGGRRNGGVIRERDTYMLPMRSELGKGASSRTNGSQLIFVPNVFDILVRNAPRKTLSDELLDPLVCPSAADAIVPPYVAYLGGSAKFRALLRSDNRNTRIQ